MAAVKHEVYSVDDCKRQPLFLFYDCEAANSNIYTGDIIEIAAKCYPGVRHAEFESLINTSQDLAKFTVEKCGINATDLEGKQSFPDVLNKFLNWIKKLVRKVNQKTGNKHFPVLCAHGGFGFDFIMLLSNMKRHKMNQNVLKKTNLHFADTFAFCKEIQADVKELSEIRLSMDSLFSTFCPGTPFLNRHRAMGDVNAMVEIFSKVPLKTAMSKIDYVTSESLCSWFETQYSAKEQKILLEDKMAKLDAYTKTVNLKKLVQIRLTYDAIQRIFENCCSFTDFYEAMKDLGIDRKTAKHFACQFGGMGLKNQGIEPYCSLPKSAVVDGEVLDFSLKDVDLLMDKEEIDRAVNVPPLPADEFTLPESSESWEGEIDESRSFTFTVPKPVPALSLTVDDFVSDLPPKTSKKKGKRNGKAKSTGAIENPTSDIQVSVVDGNTTTSGARIASRKKEDVADIVRNKAANLQVGRFPDKQKRYQLEKELLTHIEKVCEESNSEKEKNPEQSEQGINEKSVGDIPKTEEIPRTDPNSPRNMDNPSNEGKPNDKVTSQKDKPNKRKFPRKFITPYIRNRSGNKKDIEKQRVTTNNDRGNNVVTIMKRNKTRQDTIQPKHDKDSVPLKEQCDVEETEQKPSHDNHGEGFMSAPKSVKSFESKVDPTTNEKQKIAKRNYPNKHDSCKDKAENKDAQKVHHRTEPTYQKETRNQYVLKEDAIRSRKRRSNSNVLSKGSLVGGHCQIKGDKEASKEFKNKNGSEDRSVSKRDVLKENLIKNKKVSYSDLKTGKKAERSSAYDLNNVGNNSVSVTQQQVKSANGAATEETPRPLPVTHAQMNHSDKLSPVDKQAQKDTRGIEEDTKRQGSKTSGQKKGRKKKKLRKHQQNREALTFRSSSRDEKMKDWPRVEIFVGDIPIYVPFQPTDDDQNDGLSASPGNGCLQEDGHIEEQHRNEGINLGDVDKNYLHERGVVHTQDSTKSNGRKEDKVQDIALCQYPSQSDDLIKDNLSPKLSDVAIEVKEDDASVVTVLQQGLVSADSSIVAASFLESLNSVATCKDYTANSPFDDFSTNLLQDKNYNEISTETDAHVAIKKTDASQQTNELDMKWNNTSAQGKKLADQEQQTECALYTTFNNIESSLHVQDKQTLTDLSISRAQSSDTFSSCDNDSYENFQSLYESSSPPRSPAVQADIYLYDVEPQYDINTEAYNADDHGYERPAGVFNISMSPHSEDRYLDVTQFPGEDTRYPEGDTRYKEENTRYNIPSPQYEDGYYYHRNFLRKNEYSQTPHSCLPQPNVFLSNPNVIPQRFVTHSCTSLPPLYPMNPSHVPAPRLYPARFRTQYIPGHPNSPNVLPCQFSGSLNPWEPLNK